MAVSILSQSSSYKLWSSFICCTKTHTLHFFYTTARIVNKLMTASPPRISSAAASEPVGHWGVQAAAEVVELPAHINWLSILHLCAFAFVCINVDYVCSWFTVQAGNFLIKRFMHYTMYHRQCCVFNNWRCFCIPFAFIYARCLTF